MRCHAKTRQFNPEVDLVGADQAPIARHIHFVGSIKWLETPFDDHDLAGLIRNTVHVPGFTSGKTGLVIVTRTGTTPNVDLGKANLIWHPHDILSAWQPATAQRHSDNTQPRARKAGGDPTY